MSHQERSGQVTPGLLRNDIVHSDIGDSMGFRQHRDRGPMCVLAASTCDFSRREFGITKSSRCTSTNRAAYRLPSRATYYFLDRRWFNSKLSSQGCITTALRITPPNREHFCGSQFRGIDRCSVTVPSPRHLVGGIFCGSTSAKVSRSNTSRIVATMKHLHAFRDRPL